MAGQYKGLAISLIANNAAGRAVGISTAIGPRCVTAELVPNVLSGGRAVPQLRFICDGYCASLGPMFIAKRPTKGCRAIDRSTAIPTAIPAGASVTNVTVPTPYRSGAAAGGGTILGVPGQPALAF